MRELETSPIGEVLPERETQVRPLTSLPNDQRADAWTEAVESANGGQPTAKQVEKAAAKRTYLAALLAEHRAKNADAGAPASVSRDDACCGTVTATPKDAA